MSVTVKDLSSPIRGWLHATVTSALIKLLADFAEDRLLGATVVGTRVTDVLGFLALAVQERVPLPT